MIHSIFNLDLDSPTPEDHKEIILGAGCFWGVQAVFNLIDGVIETKSGYCGGHTINPSYEDVCNKTTGHAEAVKIIS